MMKFINKEQMLKASATEIITFFSEAVFKGVFSREIKSKKEERYKGNISEITLDGRKTDIIPGYLNVPKTSREIPEGPCSFKCRIKIIEAPQEDPSNYRVSIVGASLQTIGLSTHPTKEEELFNAWGVHNRECIGYYHYDEREQVYIIDDLRKSNFDNIPYYPGDEGKSPIRITYPKPIRGIALNDYYRFTWKLSHQSQDNPYEIIIDFANRPRRIEPKWFIDNLFNDRHSDTSRNFGSANGYLDTLSKQLSARESTFIYELLQNANDYPVEGKRVDVEFHITDEYLLFLHTGAAFNVRNISGICGINEKEKSTNKKAIGYKGIGFKTVFLNNHYVYIRTGEYSFRFDEKAEQIKRLEAPWPILPVWTELNAVPQEVNAVFDGANNSFQVKIALHPDNRSLLHDGRNSYEKLLRETFNDSNVILFIPNINSVRVVIDGKEELHCLRNNAEWIIGEYTKEISPELQERINKTIDDGKSRIPEKYKDFDITKVSFACKLDEKRIIPIKRATLYCYLPTNASWGFPFLMNTDMIPKGDRNDIEKEVDLKGNEKNFNEELACIAGGIFVSWIKALLTSEKYDLCSIFSLIPDFDKCIKEHDTYENYIKCFREEFEKCLYGEQIIPVRRKENANVKDVVYDTTGLSSSGIMSDEEFLLFAAMDGLHLPLPCLRNDADFNAFLERYVDDNQKFNEARLTKMIANAAFQEWLKDQGNNDKFLGFLLEKGYLETLLEEKIFLAADGGLYKASNLYYDVDKYLDDLQAFTDYIPHLSPDTRKHFADNKEWERIITGKFLDFKCNDFVCQTLLSDANSANVTGRLKDKDTSIHFFKFLAENVRYRTVFRSLPFITDNDEIVDNFEKDFLFLPSEMAHKVFEMAWLQTVKVAFISPDYTSATKEYFQKNLNVQDFSDKLVVEKIILSDKYRKGIIDNITADYDNSKSFVDYCYANKALFMAGALNAYPLHVYDSSGSDRFDKDNIFFQSERYNEYAQKEWLSAGWMYSLDEKYFDNVEDKEDLKKFIKSKFGVQEISNKNFYSAVIKKHLKEIFDNTSGSNDQDGSKNIDFVHYLDDNYELIFEEEKDYDKFGDFKPVFNALYGLSLKGEIYLFDEELEELLGNTWFPKDKDLASLCNKEYGASRALLRIGCKEYEFGRFYDDVIVKHLTSINGHIKDKETSIAFHTFIIDHISNLTPDQLSRMGAAKMFLWGSAEAVASSSGHKIITPGARELIDKGLADISKLDIIDPDYDTSKNTEYWETRLGNTKFAVDDFLTWIGDNASTIHAMLQDKALNITFWQWIKDNAADKTLPILPVVLKDNTMVEASQTIYLSDEYIQGAGIEAFVRLYDRNALFLSPDYIAEEDDPAKWESFWRQREIKCKIVDILTGTILPRLAEIEEESLPKLIAENRETLEKRYDDGLIPHLKELRVKGRDGKYYKIDETIYIDCEKEEPFPYIVLPNQISFSTADERRLIKDILDEVKGNCVTTLSVWQQQKVDRYLEMQKDDASSIRDVHYQFINDLSVITTESNETLKELKGIEDIKLLNRNDELCAAETLTMGSVYNPRFDFEYCGIDAIDYINDEYASRCEDPGKLFGRMKVHHDFQEKDVELLTHKQCAIYFWSQYIKETANRGNAGRIISKHLLDNVPCIPTKEKMKTPGELYYGKEVKDYVDKLEDWENKTPCKEILCEDDEDLSALFKELPFQHALCFLDALYALIKVSKQKERAQLLRWMIDDYNKSYDDDIEEYRNDENATWYNTKNDLVHIKELYALDKSDKSLKILDTLPRIINNAYFPSDNDSFKKACAILKITTITKEDLKTEPVDHRLCTDKDVDLKVFALVIAGIIYGTEWRAHYEAYRKKLQGLTLYRCKSMQLTYSKEESISVPLGKFHKDGSNFYFVDSLDSKKVFRDFVEAYVEFLDISKTDIDPSLIMDIMDGRESAVEVVKQHNSLMIDGEFTDELEKLIPGIRQTLHGKEADDTENEELKPHFPSKLRAPEPRPQPVVPVGAGADDQNPEEEDFSRREEENTAGEDVIYVSPSPGPRPPRPLPEPQPFTPEEIDRFRSDSNPLQLDSLPPTDEEIDVLGGYGISPEEIADTNYLAQLRLYKYLQEEGMNPAEKEENFIRNANNGAKHLLQDDRYIHTCSAAGGVMFISPSVWNNIMAGRCIVCVYLDGQGKNFHFIKTKEDFLTLVEKDDIVIKITGKEKVDVVNRLYSGILKDTRGTAYTLVRVKAGTKINTIFARYVGAMAEPEDGNDENEY